MSDRRLALVTGASAGIGLAFAELLAREGFDLAIVARRHERLEEIAAGIEKSHDVSVMVLPYDLSDANAPQEIIQSIESAGREVDVLVNNAGYALPRSLGRTSWDEIADFLEVLTISQVKLTHMVLPKMRSRKWGRVINVASLAAYAPEIPGSLYPAVKKFLVSFSRAAWLEHRNTGVHITAVCPGYTWTEFHDVLGNRKQMNSLPRFMWQTAEDVAEEGWRACERNRAVVVTGYVNKMVRVICHFLPWSLVKRIAPSATRRRPPD